MKRYIALLLALCTFACSRFEQHVGGYTQPGPVVVSFAPGGTAGANVYTDWATLNASTASLKTPLSVMMDCALATSPGTCVIPNGTWAFASKYLRFTSPLVGGSFANSIVSCASGGTVNALREVAGGVRLSADGNTPCVTISGGSGQVGFAMRDVSALGSTAGHPAVLYATDGTGNDTLQGYFFDQPTLRTASGGGTSSIQLTGTGTFIFNGVSAVSINSNSIGCTTAAQLLYLPSASTNLKSTTQTGIVDTGVMPAVSAFTGQTPSNVNATATAMTDTSPTLQVTTSRWFSAAAALFTNNRTVTLGTTGAYAGDQMSFTRNGTEAFTVAFVNGGPGAGTMLTWPASKQNSAIFQYDGTNWKLRQCGTQ